MSLNGVRHAVAVSSLHLPVMLAQNVSIRIE
jgi:hypothetical protein